MLVVLLGWPFALAEFVGGPIMIVLIWLLFRATLRPALVREAHRQAGRGLVGRMEGHAGMNMSVIDARPLFNRMTSPEGFTAG